MLSTHAALAMIQKADMKLIKRWKMQLLLA
jgi:hypothetical protein